MRPGGLYWTGQVRPTESLAGARLAAFADVKDTFFMASTAFPSRDDFAALLNESLGGEDEGFEGRVVKGTVTGIENDHAVFIGI